jgi:hypothetical protein
VVGPSQMAEAWTIGPRLLGVRATAAKVQGELLRLLARVVVNDRLAYRHPTVVAGVGAFVLVVMILGRWVRVGCARLSCVHWGPFPLGRVPGSCYSCGAIPLSDTLIIRYCFCFVYEIVLQFRET